MFPEICVPATWLKTILTVFVWFVLSCIRSFEDTFHLHCRLLVLPFLQSIQPILISHSRLWFPSGPTLRNGQAVSNLYQQPRTDYNCIYDLVLKWLPILSHTMVPT